MTDNSAHQSHSRRLQALRVLAVGLAIGCAMPCFSDNLVDVQRLLKQRQFPQALEKVDAFLVSHPKDTQVRFLKGMIYSEMGKPAEAIAVFTKLTEDFPELPEPYNNLAVLHSQQKQYDKARIALEMAIRAHPSYVIAHENLGDIYAKLASQAYDKAAQLDSSNPTIKNKLALLADVITASPKPGARPQAAIAAAKAARNVASVAASPPASDQVKPVASPAAAGGASEDIAKTIAAWASAWSNQDIKAYLAFYAADFNTPGGVSRKEWERAREQRIAGKSGKISVTYDEPVISVKGDMAKATFRQHYKSANRSSAATKTLSLVRSGGQWLIKDESKR